MSLPQSRSNPFVELIRLAVVAMATAGSYELATGTDLTNALGEDAERYVVLIVVLGAAIGYVIGGIVGRFASGKVDLAERQLRSISSGDLLAAAIGGIVGLVVSGALVWPVLLFGGRMVTWPIAAVVVVVLVTIGIRVGLSRGGDLMRSLGASGRLTVTTPSTGRGVRLVDTSVLIDGRLLDVCRGGWLEGTLVIPTYVLYELQGLADAGNDERRRRGRRGLDVLGALQRASGVSVEVTERDHPEIEAVDAKLVAEAKARKIPLLTVDGNLARIAEVQGVKVLNLHLLAEDLRPPVLPGDELSVRIIKPGKEGAQGVGYLSDGTMVVVEGARDRQGAEVTAEVTSILSNPNGRMVFATIVAEPTPLGTRASGA